MKRTEGESAGKPMPLGRSWMIGLCVACASVAMADRMYTKHPHVSYEAWFNFYGFAAFLLTVLLLGCGVGMRKMLGRAEDYYHG